MKSESIKEITVALSKAQIVFKPIKRTEKVGYDTKSGAKKYNYAPLDVVIDATKEALSANGLAVSQITYIQGGGIILETLLSHSSGEWVSGELFVAKLDTPPQILGSALTYMRRYAYSAILCVASEEDDDAQATEPTIEKSKSSLVKESTPSLPPLTDPNLIYEAAQACKTGGDLAAFALKHGYTKTKIQTILGIQSSAEITNVQVAAEVLFPKPENHLVAEAKKLGAVKNTGDKDFPDSF